MQIPIRAQVTPDCEISPELLILPEQGQLKESRFTVTTIQPSRLVRVLSGVDRDLREIAIDSGRLGASNYWAKSHSFRVSNSSLADSTRMKVELQILSETAYSDRVGVSNGTIGLAKIAQNSLTDRFEARSVIVPIVALYNTNKK